MDHLPTGSPDFRHIEVPYLFDDSCQYTYDNAGVGIMLEYPKRVGWSVIEMVRDNYDYTNGGRNTREQAASMLQAWLYFGVIHAVTDIPVDTDDYLRFNDCGQRVVSTQNLPQHLEKWRQRMMSKSEQERIGDITGLDGFLGSLELCYTGCVGRTSPLPSEVIFSMMVLLKTLIYAKLSILPSSNEPAETWYGNTQQMIHSQLRKNGGCEMDVYRLHQRLSSIAQYYATSVNPPQTTRTHANCTNKRCLALQVDKDSYQIRHVREQCACDLVSIEQSQLSTAIRRRALPVVTFSEVAGLQLQNIDLESQNPNSPYVALSHIWANGLGNPKENSLPQCQLGLLQERVNALYTTRSSHVNTLETSSQDIPFWIDTLCVPAQQASEEKATAIASMAKIYKEADKVLVIDSDLEAASCDSPVVEISTRIAISSWWTRLWTLQEGMFAKELWFQLKDGAVNQTLLMERSRVSEGATNTEDWSITRAITEEALQNISALSNIQKEIDADKGRYLLQSINWRFTSQESDETICLAILLKGDVDVKEIQKFPAADRMREFIKMQKFFPSVSLFIGRNSVGSIEEDGYRWAPKAFVGRHSDVTKYILKDPNEYHRRPHIPDTAYADARGLHVEYPGLTLELNEGFKVHPGNPNRLNIRNQSDHGWYDITLAIPPDSSLAWENLSQFPRPAVITPRPLSMAPNDRALKGILVSVYEDEENVLFSRYICEVLVRLQTFRVAEKDAVQFVTNPAKAQNLGVTQKWCVG